jgi:rhodanese-related sulfurtransferase
MHKEGTCYFAGMVSRALRMMVIVAVGAACGLAWNSLSSKGFSLDQSVFVQAGDELIPAPDAKLWLDRGALFVDARPRDFWRMSRIPGAVSLPEEDFERAFPEVEPQLRRNLSIIVYCSGYGCESSHIVARQLRERGFPAVILDEGLPAWQDEEYPLDTEPRP